MAHNLTTRQLVTLLNAMGVRAPEEQPPRITKDPQVNYAVDCIVGFVDEDEEPYDEELYLEEIEAFEEAGEL